MKKNGTLLAFSLLLFVILTSTGCTALPRLQSGQKPPADARVQSPPVLSAADYVSTLDPFSRVHSFYADLLLPLDLVSTLTLKDKFRLLEHLFGCEEAPFSVPGYFSHGPLLIRSTCRQLPSSSYLTWTSNAVFSPIEKGPLRGGGEFLPKDANPGNIRGMILMKDGFAVRLLDIYSGETAEYYLRRGFYNELADLYLHDGLPGNDDFILPLLEKGYAEAPNPDVRFMVELTRVQYLLSRGRYEEAKRLLEVLAPALPGADERLHPFFRSTYEEYVLTRAADGGNEIFLVEYDRFMESVNRKGSRRTNGETGAISGN